jgi:hypothetical protein
MRFGKLLEYALKHKKPTYTYMHVLGPLNTMYTVHCTVYSVHRPTARCMCMRLDIANDLKIYVKNRSLKLFRKILTQVSVKIEMRLKYF